VFSVFCSIFLLSICSHKIVHENITASHFTNFMEHVSARNWGSWFSGHYACIVSSAIKVAGSIPDGVIGVFHRHNPSDRTMALGVDSASNRNEYQEHFLVVKTAGA